VLSAKIDEIVPTAAPVSRTFVVKLALPVLPGLRSGMFGRARFPAGTKHLLTVPGGVGVFDALFTATSASCVTGLIVVDTGTDFTLAGQWVILILIQVGGLGIMTFAAISFRLLGLRFPLTSQAALEDSWFQRDMASEFRRTFRRILVLVASIEAVGAACLFAGFVRERPIGHALYSAVFHSISAFCNAGFSIYPDNLEGFGADASVLVPIMVLIVLGGLGHTVILDVLRVGARFLLFAAMFLGSPKHQVQRYEGAFFLVFYAVYIGWLIKRG
jgi:trk/ktr system potassium uptake protein